MSGKTESNILINETDKNSGSVPIIKIKLTFPPCFNYRKIRRHCRRSSVLQTRLKSLSSMDTAVFDEKDFIS